jgi:hypothetical protein
VIRGLTALADWAELTGERLPGSAVADAVAVVERTFPDGVVRIGRRWWDGAGTIVRGVDGGWDHRRQPATGFALLEAVSEVGAVSPYLTREWAGTRERLRGMVE